MVNFQNELSMLHLIASNWSFFIQVPLQQRFKSLTITVYFKAAALFKCGSVIVRIIAIMDI